MLKFYKTGVKSTHSFICQNVSLNLFSMQDFQIYVLIVWMLQDIKTKIISKQWKEWQILNLILSRIWISSTSVIIVSICIQLICLLLADFHQKGSACQKSVKVKLTLENNQVFFMIFRSSKRKSISKICFKKEKLFDRLC